MLPGRARAWRSWLGYALALATVIFVVQYVGLNRDDFLAALGDLSATPLVLAAVAFTLHVGLNALAFAPLNRAFGVEIPSHTLSGIWGSTLLTKYVPGGVWHIVGRGVVLARTGVTPRVTASVGILEQTVSLGLCGLIAGCFLWTDVPVWTRLIIFTLGALVVLLVPPLGFRLLRTPIQSRFYRRAVAGYGLALIPYALGYLALIAPADSWQFFGALFAGTVAGVLALPVPGGVGVRESATALLAASTAPAKLLAGMLAARAVMFTVEAGVSFVSLNSLRGRTR